MNNRLFNTTYSMFSFHAVVHFRIDQMRINFSVEFHSIVSIFGDNLQLILLKFFILCLVIVHTFFRVILPKCLWTFCSWKTTQSFFRLSFKVSLIGLAIRKWFRWWFSFSPFKCKRDWRWWWCKKRRYKRKWEKLMP